MKPSIYDVAKLAGVSTATVSRAVNNSGYISKQSEFKVKDAIQKLHYVPNEVARSFAKNSTETLGVYFPFKMSALQSDYSSELLRGISEGLEDTAFDLLIIRESGKAIGSHLPPKYSNYIEGKKIVGLIVGAVAGDTAYLQRLILGNRPVVYIGKRLIKDKGTNIYANYMSYTRNIFEYCYKKGHRKIAVLQPSFIENYDNRINIVFKEFMSDKNLPLKEDSILVFNNDDELYQKINNMMKEQKLPTALVIPYLPVVQKTITILHSLNISVPEDMSIISTEHKRNEASNIFPPVTSVYVPAFEMGHTAAELLVKMVSNDNIEKNEILFNPRVVERNSVISI